MNFQNFRSFGLLFLFIFLRFVECKLPSDDKDEIAKEVVEVSYDYNGVDIDDDEGEDQSAEDGEGVTDDDKDHDKPAEDGEDVNDDHIYSPDDSIVYTEPKPTDDNKFLVEPAEDREDVIYDWPDDSIVYTDPTPTPADKKKFLVESRQGPDIPPTTTTVQSQVPEQSPTTTWEPVPDIPPPTRTTSSTPTPQSNSQSSTPASVNTPKYMVSIQLYPDKTSDLGLNHMCDGAIISPRRVLTAAHCVFRPNGGRYLPFELVVVVGVENVPSKSPRVLDIAYIKSQGAFRRGKTLFADVAYLILKNEIPPNDPVISFIKLTSSPPKEEQECFVVSWENSAISNKPVTIRDKTFCKQLHGSMFIGGMICVSTKKSDSCPSNSGGPLICDGEVAGVVSWGMDTCGMDTAGVFTDVTRFEKWLSMGARLEANYFVVIFVTTIVFINV